MSFTVTVVVAAPPREVWRALGDVPNWPDWNPACIGAESPVPPVVGERMRLHLRHPGGRPFWTLPVPTEVEPERRLAWETRSLGMRAPSVITLEPHDDGTLVVMTSQSNGPLGFAYRLTFPEKAQAQLWSGALTGLARHFRRPAA